MKTRIIMAVVTMALTAFAQDVQAQGLLKGLKNKVQEKVGNVVGNAIGGKKKDSAKQNSDVKTTNQTQASKGSVAGGEDKIKDFVDGRMAPEVTTPQRTGVLSQRPTTRQRTRSLAALPRR